MNLSPWEIGLIVLVAFLLFGPKKLPELARSIGESIREFKKSVNSSAMDDTPKSTDDNTKDNVSSSHR